MCIIQFLDKEVILQKKRTPKQMVMFFFLEIVKKKKRKNLNESNFSIRQIRFQWKEKKFR